MPTPQSILLEIAVSSVERGVAAQRAGANRLELCESLEVGGLTPDITLVRRARAAVQLPIHVLVRPRPGNIIYSPEEFTRMKTQIAELAKENIQGVVVGVLKADHSVDIARTRELVALALPLSVTFHRAFDETPNQFEALEAVVQTGAHRILTSGGAPDAAQGAPVLRKLIEQADGRITILPGGGLHAANIPEVLKATRAAELHTGLGTILPYNDPDTAKFEQTIRACRSAVAFQ